MSLVGKIVRRSISSCARIGIETRHLLSREKSGIEHIVGAAWHGMASIKHRVAAIWLSADAVA